MAIQPKEASVPMPSTVIGESILVDGKLEGDEDLTVRGRVQGSITLTKTLIVEPTGVVQADATVRNAVISGVVVGNISASESVHLTREGRMVGDINAPRVIIVEGAAFRGRVDMGEVAEPKVSGIVNQPQAMPSRATSATTARPPAPPPVRSMATPPRPPALPSASASVSAAAGSKPAAKSPFSKPSAPPSLPSLKPAPSALATAAPLPVALGKKKVIVKRKK